MKKLFTFMARLCGLKTEDDDGRIKLPNGWDWQEFRDHMTNGVLSFVDKNVQFLPFGHCRTMVKVKWAGSPRCDVSFFEDMESLEEVFPYGEYSQAFKDPYGNVPGYYSKAQLDKGTVADWLHNWEVAS
jgi:hypothetical protein